ncbi:16S rRNA (cytosine(1402)-N(4))-methyltransferase [Candidatus Daviesbacteria bacterium RIFCSPLOWO2_02_FULL_40_8]|uniref:Ribosomal RNA small subunit methyltransferase H n=1 Tax=Candidatus Daviesbacteria bacterium RIFCSPLOWO2_01_FULL_40_24 TaxID=1797787 RepID=A0A1F5MJ49_9BACT|nr:MAG: 16S rRNA (cytosine(1402)-N(4))-methyltransferase [Candidatus Daviesbacteria bacterium RIFCSPHIGHO2_02_FULL_41_14]OGE65406.1 MAG: 16S rRNA (cytosine(1402)-N(4))-methyltransferase [Candidatus Daviesbacteria bacterium RIFCSPLOWO2_01_FULL_40_24]OGE65898.1 MAG: 16S rRNA (cytosine(1402)-N(4))-methyltransferase [Candidatus Daviesbacteria bacterium RIFCSPLOWO2_02_FULL_40_8]
MDDSYHRTVFPREVLDYLDIKERSWYLDVTLGDGGHSIEILKSGGLVVGIDVDPEAIKRAEKRFQSAGIDNSKYKLIQGNFREIDGLIDLQMQFAGCVADLGVSTLQLKVAERGFSLLQNGPLDMRMDPNLAVKAVDLINGLHKGELSELFLNYGEESDAKRIAEAVVNARPITTTTDLVRAVEVVTGKKTGYTHPATQIFQALRIAVNDEMFAIREGLPKIFNFLSPAARFCVISFHSLEDRQVKESFRDLQQLGIGIILTDKPLVPSENEVYENIRSRSAKLRIIEKV